MNKKKKKDKILKYKMFNNKQVKHMGTFYTKNVV